MFNPLPNGLMASGYNNYVCDMQKCGQTEPLTSSLISAVFSLVGLCIIRNVRNLVEIMWHSYCIPLLTVNQV